MTSLLQKLKVAIISTLQVLLATAVFFLILEGVVTLFGFPKGAARFTEIAVIKNNLSVHKPAGEFRIFTYGESTMHGSHYWPASNPARWLEAYLRDFLPGKKTRVVNFARMGQGSDFIYTSFRDTSFYKPDLAVFYMGHNAFLHGNRKDQALEEKKGFSFLFKEWMRESRLCSFFYRMAIKTRVRTKKEKPGDTLEQGEIEVSANWQGLNSLAESNSPLYRENIAYYKANLVRILEFAKKRRIPVIFFMPVANLKDFSPYCSAHMKDLDGPSLGSWKENYERGKEYQAAGFFAHALPEFETAYHIDPSFADLDFRMGEMELERGNYKRAEELFKEAKNFDCVPVRAQKEIEETFTELSKEYGFLLVDTEKILEKEVLGGIMGEPVIEDNVHFSVKGHSVVARALAGEIAGRGWIAPPSEWHFEKERPFEEIEKDLGVNESVLFEAYLKNVFYLGSRFKARLLFAEKALEIRPKDPRALRHLAWSYWLMKDQVKALEVYRKINTLYPEELQHVFQNQPSVKEAFQKAFPSR